MHNKKLMAMLLAGGQGSRLGALTKNIAKPAVSFGGKYRIIDFSLSNCANSGIDTVGVLIQYRPMVLNHYIGTGKAWDLDRTDGGVHILPPYATEKGGSWYNGTADAIYNNMDFIDLYHPENVLILSGDHLYRMDYRRMLDEHIKNRADLTVSVMEVPREEASRFGIMSVDGEGRITKFTEKPKQPESNLASMGIYIFSWNTLRRILTEDHNDSASENDFGKNIIPKLLQEGRRLFVYRFSGYWKDVGTIDSYYSAQFDLMNENSGFDIYDSEEKRIYSNSNLYPPHFIGGSGSVYESLVCNGCEIYGRVAHSVLSSGVTVNTGCVIKDSILLPDVNIGKNTSLIKTIVNEGVTVRDGITVGSNDRITVIGSDSEYAVPAGTEV